jgi:hypothetical protein
MPSQNGPQNRILLGEKDRVRRDDYAYAKTVWRAAEEFVRDPPATERPADDLLAFLEAGTTTPMPGRLGPSLRRPLRRLLSGVAEIALEYGRATGMPPSERSLVERSGLTGRTMRKVLRSAVEQRWLVLEVAQRGALAARYSLRVPCIPGKASLPQSEHHEEGVHGRGRVTGSELLSPGHDAFLGRGALPSSAYEVLVTLEEDPLQRQEIASRTGRHVQTVEKGLRRLKDADSPGVDPTVGFVCPETSTRSRFAKGPCTRPGPVAASTGPSEGRLRR